MTNCSILSNAISEQLPATFQCRQVGSYLGLTTPFTYPDGDQVEVFVAQRAGDPRIAVTDLGETVRFLQGHGVDLVGSPRREAIIQDICLGRKVVYRNGILGTVASGIHELAERVFVMGQTIVQVADLIYTLHDSAPLSFRDEVRAYLRERNIPTVSNPRINAVPQLPHRVDFGIRRPSGTRLVYVKTLSSKSRATANEQVSAAVRLWDFIHRRAEEHITREDLVTVIDDSVDVWEKPWIEQLRDHSQVVAWMNERDQLAQIAGVMLH